MQVLEDIRDIYRQTGVQKVLLFVLWWSCRKFRVKFKQTLKSSGNRTEAHYYYDYYYNNNLIIIIIIINSNGN